MFCFAGAATASKSALSITKPYYIANTAFFFFFAGAATASKSALSITKPHIFYFNNQDKNINHFSYPGTFLTTIRHVKNNLDVAHHVLYTLQVKALIVFT